MINEAFFISDQIHERQVTLADGTEHTVYFRELPHGVFRTFHRHQQSKDEAISENAIAGLIAASLCEPDGKPALTFDRASKLKPQASAALFTALLEVQGYGDEPKKD